jgi:hypothetical protein
MNDEVVDLSGLNEVEAANMGVILGPGNHLVTCTAAKRTTSANQHPQIELQLEADNGSGEIRDWLTLTQKAAPFTKAILGSFGITEFGAFNPGVLIGRKVSITVQQKPNPNDPSKPRSQVAVYRPASEHRASAPAESSAGPADNEGLPF